MGVTVLITAYREAETIGRALEAVLPQVAGLEDSDVFVICPDLETAQAARKYPQVKVIQDSGRGKAAALNLSFCKVPGEIIVMTDGDVVIGADALEYILAQFDDPVTGAVSGRPISTSPRDSLLGYWSHLLTDAGAHMERAHRDQEGRFFVCSGYLYAIRKSLVQQVPENALAEDAVISHLIADQGYRIRYAPDALVYVKYPTTYRDWLKQRVRSAGGYTQPIIAHSPLQMRSFWHEVGGMWRALRYPRTLREFFWTLLLFAARLHLWLLIWWRVRIQQRPLTELWQRVESTK
jgi:biofilm PGA synthesis N-glycosyltransferase PgaC